MYPSITKTCVKIIKYWWDLNGHKAKRAIFHLLLPNLMYWLYIFGICMCKHILYRFFVNEYTYILLYSLIQKVCSKIKFLRKICKSFKVFKSIEELLYAHLFWQKLRYTIAVTESQNGWDWREPLEVIWSNTPAQAGPPRGTCSFSLAYPCVFWLTWWILKDSRISHAIFCYLFPHCNNTHYMLTPNLLKLC